MNRFRVLAWLVACAIAITGSAAGFVYASASRDWAAYLLGFLAGAFLVFAGYGLYLELRDGERREPAAGPDAFTRGGTSNEMDASSTASRSAASAGERDSSPDPPARPRAPTEHSRLAAVTNTVVPAFAGVVPAYAVAHHELGFPAGAIGAGALTVATVLFFVNGRTYYAGGGALFCLATAVAILTGAFPPGYRGSPFVVLTTLGSLSLASVAVSLGLGRWLRRRLALVVGEQGSLHLRDIVTGIPRFCRSVWGVITVRPHLVRFLAIIGGLVGGFVLNYLGIAYPISMGVGPGVDGILLVFVGAVLLGFHTLEAMHRRLLTAGETNSKHLNPDTSGTN